MLSPVSSRVALLSLGLAAALLLAAIPAADNTSRGYSEACEASKSPALCVNVPNLQLNNGVTMPMLSLGIWQYSDAEVYAAVPLALSLGFTHIDASIFYGVGHNDEGRPNQAALGAVLARVPRSQYFLTTKIDPSFEDSTEYSKVTSDFNSRNAYYRTLEQAAHNLGDLGLDQVDLMLVHWTSPSCAVMREIWRAMETVQELGWSRAIGVSNFCPNTLECILPTAKVVPAVNQVKYHAGLESPDPGGIKSYCDKHGITLQAYSPLGGGGKGHSDELVAGDLVSRIGAKHGKSGAQVSLRWVSQNGVPLSTKSTSEQHLRDAMDAFSFRLDADDMAELDAYERIPRETYSFTCDCKAADTCSKGESPYW